MQSGKEQLCFDIEQQTTNTLRKTFPEMDNITIRTHNDPSIPVTYQPAFPEKNILYELKNLKIELPKISISDVISLKPGADGHHLQKRQTARKSLKTGDINGNHSVCSGGQTRRLKLEAEEEGINTTAKILNFSCRKCKDDTRYSPNDLQKHFQLLHRGELPSYPCEMCKYLAHDFQSFKQHRRTHRSTLVKCEICNDEQLYTLLDLTKHFTSKHCVNGHFRCEKCKFSTRDAGTFVQHLHRHNEIQYKCGKCNHVSFSKGESQRHLVFHTGTYPFSCQYCSYSATRKDYIIKHVLALHRDRLYVKDNRDNCEKRRVKTNSGLKLVLSRYKTGGSKKVLWRQKNTDTGTGTVVENNGHAFRNTDIDECKSEDQSQFVEVLQIKEEKDQTFHNVHGRNMERENLLASIIRERPDGPSAGASLLKDAIHGPTVLMVKNNKISVPANYCAKFMGFKMVNGRQHIVIKLLPTNGQNVHACELQSEAVEYFHSKTTSRTCELSSASTTAHAIKLHMQQVKQSHPLSVSVSDSLFLDKAHLETKYTNISQNTSSTAVQASSEKTIGARSNDSTPGATSATQPHIVNSCSKSPGKVDREPLKMFFLTDQKLLRKKSADEEYVPNQSFSHQDSELASSRSPLFLKDRNLDSSSPLSKMGTSDVEIDILNANVFSASGTDVEEFSFVGFNQSLESIHKERTDNWNPTNEEAHEECAHNQSFPLQSSMNNMATSAGSPLMKTRNLDDSTSVPSHISIIDRQENIVDTILTSTSKNNSETLSFEAKQDSFVKPLPETLNGKSDQLENSIDNSSLHAVPEIPTVFCLQNEQASDILLQDVNYLPQNSLKRKLDVEKNISTPEAKIMKQSVQSLLPVGNTLSSAKYIATVDNFLSTPTKGDMNINCSTTNSDKYCAKQLPITLCSSENTDRLCQNPSVDPVHKPQSDVNKVCANAKSPYDIRSLKPRQIRPLTTSEENNTALVHSSTKKVLVPLHLANQPALQVISDEIIPSGLSNTHTGKGDQVYGLLNKGSKLVLTFSGGTFGAVANVSGNLSRVLSTVNCNKGKMSTSKLAMKTDNSSTANNSTEAIFNDSVSSIASAKSKSLNEPMIKNSADASSNEISSTNKATVSTLFKKLPIGVVQYNTTQTGVVATSDTLQSVKEHQETQQKQSIYALLPNGRPVLLKYVAANRSAVPTNVLQDSTFNQNSQPKNTESMQKNVLLKILKSTSLSLPVVSKNQSQIKSSSSLNLINVHSLQNSIHERRPAVITSCEALVLPDNLIPAKSCLAGPNSTNVSPKDSESYTKRVATWMQRCSLNSTQEITCKQNSSSNQKDKRNIGNKITKNNSHLQKTNIRNSEAVTKLRSRNVKRKSEDDLWEPPTKRTLHRKCKRKNQIENVCQSSDISSHQSSDISSLAASKDTVKALRLLPFNSVQLVKCPRRNQPVVVLNHPDVDVPEVLNVMKTISKFKGHVLKVLLSKRTTNALLDSDPYSSSRIATEQLPLKRHRRLKPLSPVKERFVLKLTLKKTSKNKYQIVKNTSCNTLKAKFSCWFCGRPFDNQDDWVGHGQRHLMEATRDWNILV
uniref:Zinc finger protein 518A n=1 Tax=Geotrypetes seraphini TaxID=260995 RepID=A0A6P8QHR5_GEOSA|nr:zinc finger protein 518A [Geotrypetes seraphini]XP_033798371.1 zinc finger protein 518A [Geotrypetes seraphini]XP_033798372.1 zinc finger protein 518A [Geotrypetes seraphini]XP_033798373.1 zinc finger protein 518A [Geotrypetes seraphini]XP_033798374.1 zinc finger protein 518A [Geotrypetes seraphini]XP_033798375.1 zinc finger protein 518A [Geotrypetes seraphini]XP_033798376.1 zinc finger protein 518A [Geotrypetes seraphini]XP_033798378.1 zinc finger protein 518A [Geotrypetes seraphini]